MLIYRVENGRGIGPYATIPGAWQITHDLNGMLFTDDLTKYHPAPREDGITIDPDYFYGFQSFDLLYRWFGGYFESLERLGFHIAVYDVSEEYVMCGKMQCAFEKGMAIPAIHYRGMLDALDVFTS